MISVVRCLLSTNIRRWRASMYAQIHGKKVQALGKRISLTFWLFVLVLQRISVGIPVIAHTPHLLRPDIAYTVKVVGQKPALTNTGNMELPNDGRPKLCFRLALAVARDEAKGYNTQCSPPGALTYSASSSVSDSATRARRLPLLC
jgi:hypothetical protein